MRLYMLSMLICLPALCSAAFGEPVDESASPVAVVTYQDQAPLIDGQIKPSEWLGSAVLDGFEVLDTLQAPRERTRAWICYDTTNMYIAVRCWMLPGQKPKSEIVERDGTVFVDDCVEVFIEPAGGSGYKHFVGNSIGTQLDESGMSSSWNGTWRYAARHTDLGWECEMALPFADFGQDCPIPGSQWRLLLGRTVQHPEMQFSQWGNCQTSWHNPEGFGTIIFTETSAHLSIGDISARGLDVGISAELAASEAQSGSIKVNVTLERRAATGEAEGQAAVMIFDAPPDILYEDEAVHELDAGQIKSIDLPLNFDEEGGYVLNVSARGASGDIIFKQRIPLDKLRPLTVDIQRFPTQGTAEFAVNINSDTLVNVAETIELTLCDQADVVLWQVSEKKDSIGAIAYNGYGVLPPGSYELQIDIKDRRDRIIFRDSVSFSKATTPPWYDNQLGRDDTVLPPWTPVEVDDNVIEIWGRRYVFASSGFVSQILNQGQEMLAEPVRLTAIVDGKAVDLTSDGAIEIVATDSKATVTAISRVTDYPAVVKVVSVIEFDGFVWTRITLKPYQDISLERFLLEFPIKRQYARYHLPVFNGPVAIPPDGLTAPVVVRSDWKTQSRIGVTWVGSEELGLSISSEDDRDWKLHDRDKALALVPQDDQLLWRFHFIDRSVTVNKALSFNVCWQPTPAKPVEKWYSHRVVGDGGRHNYRLLQPEPPEGPMTRGELAYRKGIKVMHCHENWTEIMGYPGTFTREKEVKLLMRNAHQFGQNYVLYSQNVISSIAPEFAEWGNEFALSIPLAKGFSRTPPQDIYFTCKGSCWTDFYIWYWVRMIKEYGVNGMYLDGSFSPSPCKNPAHGHGYIDSQGQRREVQPIRAAREFVIRLIRAAREVDPDFYFLAHGHYTFTTHFMDYVMAGENFWMAPPGFEIPLDHMRVVYGRQWSAPMEFYRGPVLTQKYIFPLALAHGIGTWTADIIGETNVWHMPLWKVWEDYGIEEAEFVGYWQNSPHVTSSHPDVVASYHLKKDSLLLAAATARRDVPNAVITIDLPGLGFDPESIAARTGLGQSIDVAVDDRGFLKLRFPEQTCQDMYVWISATKTALH